MATDDAPSASPESPPAETPRPPLGAWQPFTPPGVAAFARASLSRLLLMEFIFAMVFAACMVWTLDRAWWPVADELIPKLPEMGEISRGELLWYRNAPVQAGNHFLSLSVNPGVADEADASDFQVVFGQKEIRLRSLLGWTWYPYSPEWKMPLNRTELWPWWGAWRPAILAGVFVATVVWLLLCWPLVALIYAPMVRLIAFMANRESVWTQNWRLASAALMPGAVIMSAGLVLYGLGAINFVKLLLVVAFHFVAGWVYLCISPFFLPREEKIVVPVIASGLATPPPKENPFNKNSPSASGGKNPFAPPGSSEGKKNK